MKKNSYVMYKSWNPLIRTLPDAEAGQLLKAIATYQSGDQVETFENPMLNAVFEMIKAAFVIDDEKYRDKCEQNAQNGSKGGKAKAANASERKETLANASDGKTNLANLADKDLDKDLDFGNDFDNGFGPDKEKGDKSPRRAKRFTPPTVEEVRAYCLERSNGIDPQRFVDFYASKGWMVGRNKMKDWQAALRNWEKINEKQHVAVDPLQQKFDALKGFGGDIDDFITGF